MYVLYVLYVYIHKHLSFIMFGIFSFIYYFMFACIVKIAIKVMLLEIKDLALSVITDLKI